MKTHIQRLCLLAAGYLGSGNSVQSADPPAMPSASAHEKTPVVGENSADGYGVSGKSKRGVGVYGFSKESNGVLGETEANGTAAVSGLSKNDSHGVYGRTDGNGHGVFGTSAIGAGLVGHSVKWVGVYGFSKEYYGVWGETEADEHPAVVGIHKHDGPGVFGRSDGKGHGVLGSTTAGSGVVGQSVQSAGVVGRSQEHDGVLGVTEGKGTAGVTGASINDGHGVLGRTEGMGTGVWGLSTMGSGVVGGSVKGSGVAGHSQEHEGVHGETQASNFAAIAGIHQKDGTGVFGRSVGQGIGVVGIGHRGGVTGESPNGPGVLRTSVDHHGVSGESSANERAGVAGVNKKHGYGVHGRSQGKGYGVYGTSTEGRGVVGDSEAHDGVLGIAHVAQKSGVVGLNDHASGFGVWAASLRGTGIYAKGNTGALLESDQGQALRMVVNETDDANTSIMDATVGTNGQVFRLSRSGQVTATRFQSMGPVVAEEAMLSEAAQTGDVVEIDPTRPGSFRLTRTPNSSYVAGVLVASPGLKLGAEDDGTPSTQRPCLALAGHAAEKVSAENGAIRSGDLLVASSTPGHAMKSPVDPKPGTVIGKSLGNLLEDRGIVEMIIMLR